MGHSLNVKSKNQWNPGFKWVTTHTVSRWSVSGHPLSHKKRKDSRRTNIKKTISLPFLFELDWSIFKISCYIFFYLGLIIWGFVFENCSLPGEWVIEIIISNGNVICWHWMACILCLCDFLCAMLIFKCVIMFLFHYVYADLVLVNPLTIKNTFSHPTDVFSNAFSVLTLGPYHPRMSAILARLKDCLGQWWFFGNCSEPPIYF